MGIATQVIVFAVPYDEATCSHSEPELNIKTSGNYLMSKFSADVSLSEADKRCAESRNLKGSKVI